MIKSTGYRRMHNVLLNLWIQLNAIFGRQLSLWMNVFHAINDIKRYTYFFIYSFNISFLHSGGALTGLHLAIPSVPGSITIYPELYGLSSG